MTYFVFKCLKVRQSTLIKLSTVSLILGTAMESYCFIVIIYKVKYYGYVLILIVIFFNFIFNMAKMYFLNQKTAGEDEHLWEEFRLNKKQSLDCFTITIVGMLDMTYVFLLFWSANGFPIWLMVTLL